MITERVEILIKDSEENNFISAMNEGENILLSAGSTLVRLQRGIENPSKFLLLIDWETVDAHIDFTKTELFGQFKDLVGIYFAGKPEMEHFKIVSTQ